MADRRAFLYGSVLMLAAPLSIGAQPAGKVYRIGFLFELTRSAMIEDRWRTAFRQGGYAEGQNAAFEFRYAGERFERLPALADELVRLKVDIIVTSSTPPAVAARRARGLMVIQDPVTLRAGPDIAKLAAKHRLPATYPYREPVDAGGLMSYGPSNAGLREATVAYADRVLRGAPPGDLPMEQPTKFELVINLKTAKALGLTIPPSLLLRADQVIE